MERWKQPDPTLIVNETLADRRLWGDDLSKLPGFTGAV